MATMCLTPVLHPFRLYVLWGFVVVTTSVTKVAKRKVSHQLIIKLEFMRNRVAAAGVRVEEQQSEWNLNLQKKMHLFPPLIKNNPL